MFPGDLHYKKYQKEVLQGNEMETWKVRRAPQIVIINNYERLSLFLNFIF